MNQISYIISRYLIIAINFIDSLTIEKLIIIILGLISLGFIGINILGKIDENEEISTYRFDVKLLSVIPSLAILIFPLLYHIEIISINIASIVVVLSIIAIIINTILRVLEYGIKGISVWFVYFIICAALFFLNLTILSFVISSINLLRISISGILVFALLCIIRFNKGLERWSAY